MATYVVSSTILTTDSEGKVGYYSVHDALDGVDAVVDYVKRNLEVDLKENQELLSIMISETEESTGLLEKELDAGPN